MKFHYIEINQWERKEYFEHYLKDARCSYSITVNIEVTNLLNRNDLQFYPGMLYLIATLVNRHREFRTCFDQKGKLGFWKEMSPGDTIFHANNNTFSCIWTEYQASF